MAYAELISNLRYIPAFLVYFISIHLVANIHGNAVYV